MFSLYKAVRHANVYSIDLSQRRAWFDESGGEGEEKIDWSKVDPSTVDWSVFDVTKIPEDVVKKLPAYQSILNETIDRRKKIKALQDELNKLTSEGNDDKEDKAKDKKTEDQGEEMPVWAKEILDRMERQQQTTLSDWRKQAGILTGLNKSQTVLDSIQGSSFDDVLSKAEKIATDLGIPKPQAQVSGIATGNPAQQRDASVLEAIKAQMHGGRGRKSPFNADIQKAIGGGILEND